MRGDVGQFYGLANRDEYIFSGGGDTKAGSFVLIEGDFQSCDNTGRDHLTSQGKAAGHTILLDGERLKREGPAGEKV